mmetsp:Transcript_1955/g.7013  ORF Transcript_1955/g.7013 Transcript_1955/m.7013 type:complete len:208 (+) Transcript_1955:1960-2583(+)
MPGAFPVIPMRCRLAQQLRGGQAAFIRLEVPLAVTEDRHVQARRECVAHRHTHSVQASGDFVAAALPAELASRVQHGEHRLQRRDARSRVDVHWNAATIIRDLHAPPIGTNQDLDARGVASLRLVDGIVQNLVQQMMQAFYARAANVHARALAHWLQTLQHLDLGGVVILAIVGGASAVHHFASERVANPHRVRAATSRRSADSTWP